MLSLWTLQFSILSFGFILRGVSMITVAFVVQSLPRQVQETSVGFAPVSVPLCDSGALSVSIDFTLCCDPNCSAVALQHTCDALLASRPP